MKLRPLKLTTHKLTTPAGRLISSYGALLAQVSAYTGIICSLVVSKLTKFYNNFMHCFACEMSTDDARIMQRKWSDR